MFSQHRKETLERIIETTLYNRSQREAHYTPAITLLGTLLKGPTRKVALIKENKMHRIPERSTDSRGSSSGLTYGAVRGAEKRLRLVSPEMCLYVLEVKTTLFSDCTTVTNKSPNKSFSNRRSISRLSGSWG
ncbi:hypothetical protein CDAR_55951 [Caerostris darwini]|uniref:Uncharacterized protein n=1 Tax=Caerostris darwini TaxID=1538125 RepID=A0AAV4UQ83_9ARAC|nr:hypothetical protein CDAR_55951 [Caerostris darwini]